MTAPLSRTFTDRYGRVHTYLRISLTDRCNFRCSYCMPQGSVDHVPRDELLSFEEILRLASLFAEGGVTKIRLTGGEPTVRRDFVDLVGRLRQVPGINEVHLTTNGFLLAQLAESLAKAGISGINVSLDSLRRETFQQITGFDGLDQVLSGIESALNAGIATNINVVVLPEVNEGEMEDFVALTAKWPSEVRFIEFMPFLENGWSETKVIPSSEIRRRLARRFELLPVCSDPQRVATRFDIPGMRGSIGFVSSVSESFCASCNRLRLTADGQFKTCLFLPPNLDLKSMLRGCATDEDLQSAIHGALQAKWKEHPPMDRWSQLDSLSMVQIGG